MRRLVWIEQRKAPARSLKVRVFLQYLVSLAQRNDTNYSAGASVPRPLKAAIHNEPTLLSRVLFDPTEEIPGTQFPDPASLLQGQQLAIISSSPCRTCGHPISEARESSHRISALLLFMGRCHNRENVKSLSLFFSIFFCNEDPTPLNNRVKLHWRGTVPPNAYVFEGELS